MSYDFDTMPDRRNTYSLKWDFDGFFYKFDPNMRLDDETTRLVIADMDYASAPAITKAMHRVADHPSFGYTLIGAAPGFLPSIKGWYQKRFGLDIEEDSIVYTGGALEAIRHAVFAFTKPKEGVIICRPVYGNFTDVILNSGRTVANCQLLYDGEGNYSIDWESFENICSIEENRLFVLCSPANPIGKVWTVDELRNMASICKKHHVVLISDEIHSDIVRKDSRHYPVISAADDLSNIIMVSGANKSFNLMGLHCAYAIIPDPDLRKEFTDKLNILDPTPFAIGALMAAYNESEPWLDGLNDYIDGNIEYAVQYFKEHFPTVKVVRPEGTYVLWLDFSEFGSPVEEVQRRVNREANIFIQNGTYHDPENGNMFLRMCLTCSRAVLVQALDKMREIL